MFLARVPRVERKIKLQNGLIIVIGRKRLSVRSPPKSARSAIKKIIFGQMISRIIAGTMGNNCPIFVTYGISGNPSGFVNIYVEIPPKIIITIGNMILDILSIEYISGR